MLFRSLRFSLLTAIRVVSSAYLRLLIFLLAVLIPACASSSPACLMIYSACKLNKQSDKNTLEGINSRISEAEERISELEDKMVEIIFEEQNKVKRMKRIEDSLRGFWDHIKCTNI